MNDDRCKAAPQDQLPLSPGEHACVEISLDEEFVFRSSATLVVGRRKGSRRCGNEKCQQGFTPFGETVLRFGCRGDHNRRKDDGC